MVGVQVLVDKNYGGGAWLRLSVQVGLIGLHVPARHRSCLVRCMLDAQADKPCP